MGLRSYLAQIVLGRELLARERSSLARMEAAREQAAVLAETSTLLASSLDYESTLQRLAQGLVPGLADLCVLDIVDDDGEIRRLAAAHADPARASLVRELQERFPPDRHGEHPVARALRAGTAQVAADISPTVLEAIAPDAGHRDIARTLQYTSYVVVPLVARGRTLGALSLVSAGSGRRYTAADVPFAEDLARRAAVAIDNARLFRDSETRRRAAQTLTEVGRFLNQALDPDVVAQRITDSVRALLGVGTSVFYRVDAESLDCTVVAVSGALAKGLEPGTTLPAGAGTVGLAVRERKPVSTSDMLTDPRVQLPRELRSQLQHQPYRSVLALPLLSHERVIGVLALGDRAGRDFHADEIVLAQGVGEQATLALENARLYAEAQHANRAKDEFLATLSHELRTPLTAMLGWVRMLQTGALEPAMVSRALEVIDRNTKIQAQLIEDLLDVSRIVTGKLRLDFRAVDVAALVDAALETVTPAAETKSITLVRCLDPAAGLAWADPHRLQQIVWNLLSNAIKFTPAGGTITVTVERLDPHVAVSVTDTGAGIAPEFLPYLFDRFRQADSTSTRMHGGLGLGLAIVRHLVTLHRGSVEAESRGLGAGATFRVRIPMAPIRALDETAIEPSDVRRPPLAGVRVLLVDDEQDTRELVTAVLEQAGAQVVVAASAAEALEALARARPHVLVSDVAMPDEDGYALLHRVRALGAADGGGVPAVALTAYGRAKDRARALAAGFQVHVPKPVDPADLVDVVARLARR
ncbi:MAG TPA: GAF domain-containing protein [Methylomirabilota bacterium]|nr:GAF domain-containing protein [Methylomirabilota bacterium]